MEIYKVGDVVDLLEGETVVGRGTIMHMGPNAILHGNPLPQAHFGLSITVVYKPDVDIPFPPPHDLDVLTLAQTSGYVIAWPRFAIAVCFSS